MGKRGRLPKNKLPVGESVASCSPTPYKPSKQDLDRERRYKAEDALCALQRAREVEQDKQLMSDVKSLAKEQMRALNKVAGDKDD